MGEEKWKAWRLGVSKGTVRGGSGLRKLSMHMHCPFADPDTTCVQLLAAASVAQLMPLLT
jgi:hypothetical protein